MMPPLRSILHDDNVAIRYHLANNLIARRGRVPSDPPCAGETRRLRLEKKTKKKRETTACAFARRRGERICSLARDVYDSITDDSTRARTRTRSPPGPRKPSSPAQKAALKSESGWQHSLPSTVRRRLDESPECTPTDRRPPVRLGPRQF